MERVEKGEPKDNLWRGWRRMNRRISCGEGGEG